MGRGSSPKRLLPFAPNRNAVEGSLVPAWLFIRSLNDAVHEPDSPSDLLSTAKGTGDLRLASLFWMQPQRVGLEGPPAGAVGQDRPCLRELVSLRVSAGTLLAFWAKAEEQRRPKCLSIKGTHWRSPS